MFGDMAVAINPNDKRYLSFIGKNIVVVTNLKGSKIFGIQSEGMLLAAKKGKKLSLITSNSDDLVLGEKIY